MDVQELRKLDGYLKRLFHSPSVRVVPRPKRDDTAEVYMNGEMLGLLTVDDEDDDHSYNFRMEVALMESPGVSDAKRLDAYFAKKFEGAKIHVVPRPRKTDSMDVHAGDEFIGVLFVGDRNDGRTYILEMSILDIDLDAPPAS